MTMAYFNVISLHLPRGIENNDEHQLYFSQSQLGFNSDVSKI
jgi:hypothetical protein